jgi:hypothetical protein
MQWIAAVRKERDQPLILIENRGLQPLQRTTRSSLERAAGQIYVTLKIGLGMSLSHRAAQDPEVARRE